MPPDAPRLIGLLGVGVVDANTPVLHGDDLGLTRGDGCFDATRLVVLPDGRKHIDHLDAHLARFARSAAALELPPVDEAAWRELIDKAVAAWDHPGEAGLRVMLTRGRESAPGEGVAGVLTITPIGDTTIRTRAGVSVATLARGMASDAFADAPWLLGGVKTLSYAINVAAAREATRLGVDDVLFVSSDGYALEGPRSSLIWRVGERLVTTRLDGTGVLASISQAVAFAGAAAEGVETSFELVTVDELAAADGAWLLSSGRLIAPILTLDGAGMRHDPAWTARLRGWVDPLA